MFNLYSGESVDVFLHEEAVYGLSVDPVNPNVFASACDDGRVLIYDLRAPSNDGKQTWGQILLKVFKCKCKYF